MNEARIRILVADDHPIVREGLVAILETQPDFDVVGEAATGGEAVRLATTLAPDILLLDLEMPELDGVEVLRRVRVQCPSDTRADLHGIRHRRAYSGRSARRCLRLPVERRATPGYLPRHSGAAGRWLTAGAGGRRQADAQCDT